MAPEINKLAPMAWAMALARKDPNSTGPNAIRAPAQRKPTHSITAISMKLAADSASARAISVAPQPAMAWATASKLSLWNSRHSTQAAAISSSTGTTRSAARATAASRCCGGGRASASSTSTGSGAGEGASGAVTGMQSRLSRAGESGRKRRLRSRTYGNRQPRRRFSASRFEQRRRRAMAREDWQDREDERRRAAMRGRDDYGQADYSSDYGYDPHRRSGYRAEEDLRPRTDDFGQADYTTDYGYDTERGRAYRRYSEDDRDYARRTDEGDYRPAGQPRSWMDRAGDFFSPGGRPRVDDTRAVRRRRGPSDRVPWAVIAERLDDERGLDP